MAWTYAGNCASRTSFAVLGEPVGTVAGGIAIFPPVGASDDYKFFISFEIKQQRRDNDLLKEGAGSQC